MLPFSATKKFLTSISIIAGCLFLAGVAHASPAYYSYYRAVTVTSTVSVASGTNTNFPMLFKGTYTWLESTSTASSTGRIQTLVTAPNGGTEPADLIFVTSTPTLGSGGWNCGTSLNFETESYSSSTGVINDWVNVPALSAGTTLYACYASTGVNADQSHPSSTWNSNYQAVYHFAGTSSTTDSTAGANVLATSSLMSATTAGQIDGAVTSSATTAFMATTNNIAPSSTMTVSGWVNLGNYNGNSGQIITQQSPAGNNFQFGIYPHVVRFLIFNGGSTYSVSSAGSLSLGQWYYVVGTYDGTNLNAYLNGVEASAATPAPNTNSTPLTVSNLNNGGGSNQVFGLEGALDEVRMMKGAVSPSWVTTEYNNQNSPSTFYGVGSEQIAPPTISNVTSTQATSTATVTWTTSVSADSLVNYGTSTAYASSSTYSGTYVTSHSVSLTGLTPNTTYHYQTVSSDGAVATSSDSTFTTTSSASPTNISAASTQHWAWNDAIGWIDFYDTQNIIVSSATVKGYASSSAGYISFNCGNSPSGNICGTSDYGVSNDGNGNLSGWGWNDTYGWISFCGNASAGSTFQQPVNSWVCPSSPTYQVVINPSTGVFSGWAWNDTIGWISFNCSNTSSCGTSQYDVVTSWTSSGGTQVTGTLDSETFDTGVTGGAQLNSVTWQGSAPSSTAVGFQFAVSNSSSGPWTYTGPDGTSVTSYAGIPGVPISLTDYPALSGRYFRYRIILTTNSNGTATPRVTGVVVNWSP